jgi:rhodanese-related sulfurtransferase
MKTIVARVATLALVLATVSCAAQPPAENKAPVSQGGISELSRAQFEALLANPGKLLIVDVRRPDELSRVGGFPVYLSVQLADLEKNLALIPKDRTIVTVSNHAARSGRAADLLEANGYTVAGTVGAMTFEEQGGTLTKYVIPPPRTAPDSVAAPTGVAAPAASTN